MVQPVCLHLFYAGFLLFYFWNELKRPLTIIQIKKELAVKLSQKKFIIRMQDNQVRICIPREIAENNELLNIG